MEIKTYNDLGFDKNGFDELGFDKNGNHKNGTIYDNNGFDQFGFDENGRCVNGYYYDESDTDCFGFQRIFIQQFLTELRSFLNINHQLNVYCIVKFNNNLSHYLKKNNLKLKDLIKIRLKNINNILDTIYIETFKEIYDVNIF